MIDQIIEQDTAINYPEFHILEHDCFPAEPFNEKQFAELLSNDYWTARIDGELAGYIEAKRMPDRLHLSRLAVHTRFRHKGLGGRLVDQVSDLARRINSSCITLTVRTNNLPAYQLYLRKGFSIKSYKYRFAIPVHFLPETSPVEFVQVGEGRNRPISFKLNGQEIASGKFNIQVGGCKDFELTNPDADILAVLTAIKIHLHPEGKPVYIMTGQPSAIKALQALPFAEITELADMIKLP